MSQALNNSSVSLYEELNIRKESLQAQARRDQCDLTNVTIYIIQDCDMANDIVEIASYTCSK